MDTISNMLIQIKNALAVKKSEVVLPYSKFKHNLALVLEKHRYLTSVEITSEKNFKFLKMVLKYDKDGSSVISGVKRISKPGQRIYASVSDIPRVYYGFGSTIVSTSRGLMTDKEARKAKLGGEVICQIW